jgi:tetratricopeptide (TPR) repeat protein
MPEQAPPDAPGTPGSQLWRYTVTGLPAGHGYARGDMLALYAPRPDTNDEKPVGFGHVVEALEHSLLFAASYVDINQQGVPLRLGPVSGGHHFGKQLGQVVDLPKERRARIDMGRDHGVVLGDLYTVLGPAVGAADLGSRSLGRAPVGLLQVIEVQDLHALARIETGQAQPGAHVAHVGYDAGVHRTEPGVRLLVTRFLGGDGQAFALKLKEVIEQELGDRQGRDEVTVQYQDDAVEEASHGRVRSLGMAYGADIVVWGSVRRVDARIAVAAQVTFTNPERMDVPGREWDVEQMLADSLLDDRGDAVSRRIGSLAAYLAGLSYYLDHEFENGAWARAAYYLARVSEQGEPEDARNAREALFDCYERTGQWDKAEAMARQVEADGTSTGNERRKALGLYMRAKLAYKTGRLDEAHALARQSADIKRARGDARNAAVAMALIADIYYLRGDLDEALRIRRDELLPIFQKLGDIRGRAITMGNIADIYYDRGDLDNALRIRRDEELPVFQELGDIREWAITISKIADIYYARGDLNEAFRIRRDELLPVFQKLGDLREHAITMSKIADIYHDRGDLDEALRIRRDELLPVFQKLGDIRSRATTIGKIADIYYDRGDLDEALRIYRDELLPVFQKLGDVRAGAITMERIAGIYYDRGDLDEALRIRRDEVLPVFQKLSDIRSCALTIGKIADIYYRRGEPDEALRIRRDEELPILKKLGDRHANLVSQASMAVYLLARNRPGDRTEAQRLLAAALRVAEEMRLPEAERIRTTMKQNGL